MMRTTVTTCCCNWRCIVGASMHRGKTSNQISRAMHPSIRPPHHLFISQGHRNADTISFLGTHPISACIIRSISPSFAHHFNWILFLRCMHDHGAEIWTHQLRRKENGERLHHCSSGKHALSVRHSHPRNAPPDPQSITIRLRSYS